MQSERFSRFSRDLSYLHNWNSPECSSGMNQRSIESKSSDPELSIRIHVEACLRIITILPESQVIFHRDRIQQMGEQRSTRCLRERNYAECQLYCQHPSESITAGCVLARSRNPSSENHFAGRKCSWRGSVTELLLENLGSDRM